MKDSHAMAPMDIAYLLLGNLLALYVAVFLVWVLSLQLKDASIIDICWGLLCAAPALLTFFRIDGAHPRDLVITLCAGLWGMRLAGYLARRNIGHGEDERYVAMRRSREKHGDFVLWSLIWVYLLQATVAWVVSLPVQAGQIGPDRPLGPLVWLGLLVFATGLAFEAIGDAQLAAFKKDPSNKGKLMDRGLWAWTRHPNYFGDACVWFGLALMALDGPLGWIGIASPFVMAHFLVNISGKALLERNMVKKYGEAYEAYKNRTSGFFPRPPGKA